MSDDRGPPAGGGRDHDAGHDIVAAQFARGPVDSCQCRRTRVAAVLDFFAASIENDDTRVAYHRAVCNFFAWLGNRAVRERAAARPTVKQRLAAIRMLFDWLIVGQMLAVNPAQVVRGPKHVVNRGKTPVLTEEQAETAARQH